MRVLGLGALEYALLGPAACSPRSCCSRTACTSPTRRSPPAVGDCRAGRFIAALWAVGHRDRFPNKGGWREGLSPALESIHVLKCLFKTKHLMGPLGTAICSFGDIVCLWACLKAFTHGMPDIELLLLGYATGYALTRRTLPLAGAGAVELLLRLHSVVRHLAHCCRSGVLRICFGLSLRCYRPRSECARCAPRAPTPRLKA